MSAFGNFENSEFPKNPTGNLKKVTSTANEILVFCQYILYDKVALITQQAEHRMTLQMSFNPSLPLVITVGTCNEVKVPRYHFCRY